METRPRAGKLPALVDFFAAGLAELARPSFDMPLALLQLVITTVGVLLT